MRSDVIEISMVETKIENEIGKFLDQNHQD